MKIKCTTVEQVLIKRSIKANECNPLCEYKPYCDKPVDMTCGEYILSMVKWDIEGSTNE